MNAEEGCSIGIRLLLSALFFSLIASCGVDRTTPTNGNTADAACHVCHGSTTNNAPPRDTTGNTDTTARGVGAHQSHLAESDIAIAFSCTDCHVVPETFDHATSHPQIITFGTLAKTGNLSPEFNGTTCTNTYCHGNTLTGGTNKTPNWTTVDNTQAACGTCHGLPPLDVIHVASWEDKCHLCHSNTIAGPSPLVITDKTKHINGVIDRND